MLWCKCFLIGGLTDLKKTTTNEEHFLQIEKRIYKLKIAEMVFIIVLAIVVLGSLVFIIGLQFNSKNPTYQSAAEIVNTYTGIILGFVAMAVSLLSMILGFHNTKQTEQSNLNSAKEFTKLSSATDEIKSLEQDLRDKITVLSSNLDKLSELNEIKGELASLASQIQSDVDKQKGIKTQGVESLQVGDFSEASDEFDDR